MIRVLIVEDSPVIREFLVHILSSDPDIHVIGTASNGEEAIKIAAQQKPDIITMDMNMPGMDGFEATRKIMETQPTPIIIVSGSWDTHEVAATFRAVEAGALTVLPRPAGIGHPDQEATAQALIQNVKLMSEVKVVRRWARRTNIPTAIRPPASPGSVRNAAGMGQAIKLVAIGASTGGPLVLQTILAALPQPFRVPIVIVQHIAVGFVAGFAEWLEQTTSRPVRIGVNGEMLLPDHVYIAPDSFQMKVSGGGRIVLTQSEAENGMCPAVSYLFRSVADVYGSSAIGVLLTGMGKDGAAELVLMKQAGAITLVQDAATSVVHGMPGEAIKLGGATYVLSPARIAASLTDLVNS